MTCADKIAEAHNWPDRLMLRDTGLHDDLGGPGQRIYTTAGRGYERVEYVRADLADAQAQEIARLKAIIARMDGAVPVADKTCDQPGITLSEAVMRQWPELRVGSGR